MPTNAGNRPTPAVSSRVPRQVVSARPYSKNERRQHSSPNVTNLLDERPMLRERPTATKGLHSTYSDLSSEALDKMKGELQPVPPRKYQKFKFGPQNEAVQSAVSIANSSAKTDQTPQDSDAIHVAHGPCSSLLPSTEVLPMRNLNISENSATATQNSVEETDDGPIPQELLETHLTQRRLSGRTDSLSTGGSPATPSSNHYSSSRERITSSTKRGVRVSGANLIPGSVFLSSPTEDVAGSENIDSGNHTSFLQSSSSASKLNLTNSLRLGRPHNVNGFIATLRESSLPTMPHLTTPRNSADGSKLKVALDELRRRKESLPTATAAGYNNAGRNAIPAAPPSNREAFAPRSADRPVADSSTASTLKLFSAKDPIATFPEKVNENTRAGELRSVLSTSAEVPGETSDETAHIGLNTLAVIAGVNPLADKTHAQVHDRGGGNGAVCVLVAEDEQPAKEKRQQEWLQVPDLFYLFANIIELHELQQQERELGVQGMNQSSLSIMSIWNTQQRQLIEQQKRVAYSAFEVNGVFLNPLFVQWSHPELRALVKDVTKSLMKSGSDSKEFERASFLLLDAISSDKAGTVTYTQFYSLRQYVGDMAQRVPVFVAFTAMTIISILCVVFLGAFGRHHVGACIALSIVLGIMILLTYGLATLVMHHNAYAHAAATFFRDEAMSSTQENIVRDENINDTDSSFVYSEPWSQPFDGVLGTGQDEDRDEQDVSYVNSGHADNDQHFGRHRCRTPSDSPMLETDEGFASMISRSLQPADPSWRKQLERDRENALLMSTLNFEQHQLNVKQYQDQIVRSKMEANPLLADVTELAKGDFSAHESKRIVEDLTESISITALIYCRDCALVQQIADVLWRHNFLVFNASLAALDKAFHHGSERFKIFLLHAPDLRDDDNNGSLQTVLSWMSEKRPMFFFSSDVGTFPAAVPLTSRMEVPLSDGDVNTLLLSGIGVDEELNSCPTQQKPFKVPNYTLGRRLGGGAFGNVFEAEIELTGAKCAVKRMYLKEDEDGADGGGTGDGSGGAEQGPSSQLLEIAQEVEIMSSLSHPNIVQYIFCERNDNCISIFMELCSGGSLTSYIENNLLGPDDIQRVLSDIISAVVYLHSKRIVHRDLKPDNVLFRDGRAKLTDFGTAVHKRGDLKMVKGTFAYMAPEILVGEPYGKACDVWSIGCIAADVLSVELPQRTLALPAMCDYYRGMDLNSSLEIDCEVPVVKNFLECCLQRSPSNRPPVARLLQHEMLHPSSAALNRWTEIVECKRSLAETEARQANQRSANGSLNSSIVFRQS